MDWNVDTARAALMTLQKKLAAYEHALRALVS